MTLDLDVPTFETKVRSKGILLVDFWASWCGPCKVFGPIYEEASNEFPEVTFGKVDTEAQPELAGAFGIRAIPTLMAFRDGILVFSQAGALPGDALRELIGAVQALDMDDVRKQVEEQGKKKLVVEP